MRNAIVLDANDIKKILAERYGVDEKDIIKSQYSFTIMVPEDDEKTD